MKIKIKLIQYLLKGKIEVLLKKKKAVNIIIGAGNTRYKGWVCTDLPVFNVLKASDWLSIFQKRSIDRILAEHVIDYWKEDKFRLFLRTASLFLSNNGYIRIAVPDGFNPNPAYAKYIRSGVDLNGFSDRKAMFYDYIMITKILSEEQYNHRFLEYFNEKSEFIYYPWKREDGFVKRSAEYDKRNKNVPLSYTSLIVDAWVKGNRYD